ADLPLWDPALAGVVSSDARGDGSRHPLVWDDGTFRLVHGELRDLQRHLRTTRCGHRAAGVDVHPVAHRSAGSRVQREHVSTHGLYHAAGHPGTARGGFTIE